MQGRRLALLGAAWTAVALLGASVFDRIEDSASGAEPGGAPKVMVRTTGNHSETRKTVPITRRRGAEKRVVMSMGPHKLPGLIAGDRLELSAELQVTNDCVRPVPRCAGRPYTFNPIVGSKLVLAPHARTTGGRRAIALSSRKVVRCRQRVPDGEFRQHHCVIVFTHTSLDVAGPGTLPCTTDTCHVNFVIDAHNKRAGHGDKLVIGANKPDGRILQDKGRINAIRSHPGSQPRPPTLKTTKRRHRWLPLDQSPTVVLSKRLAGLKRHEQLAVTARMRTDVSHLPYSARVTTHLILARHRSATSINRRVARIASLHGQIAETNGSNCTGIQSPCPYTKAGVLWMRRDATNRAGDPIPLYVNLYVVSNPKGASPAPGARVKVLRGATTRVVRYPASLRG
jgi:hypothetical protein